MKSSSISVSPARTAAFDILLRIARESSYASELLHSRICADLSAVDHSLATELVMGVLRWRSLLDQKIAAISSQPIAKLDVEILTALRLGIYQLGWLSRIPAHAAIHESVDLVKRARKRSAASFVNAVLRRVSADSRVSAASVSAASATDLASFFAHPLWLVERWINAYGLEATARICRYNQSVPPAAIRMRPTQVESCAQLENQLRSEGIELSPGVLLASARRISRGDVTQTSLFHDGLCVVQDEASQLVAALVGHGTRILDCCAAPGGKASLIAENNSGSEIVAVELHSHRARLLQKLLSRRNEINKRVFIVSADARTLPFSRQFDRVLADVPCSGTGTLARNPEIKWRLSPEDLSDLQSRQLAILRSALARLSSGGRLVYSTCSLEKEEGEDVVERVLKEDSALRLIDCSLELDRLKQQGVLIWTDLAALLRGPYLRTLPGCLPCDGFFAAILEKR